LALTSFEIGKLKIAAHVREELDRAGITAQSIQCKSGGTHTHTDTARLIVTANGISTHVDFKAHEVEDCEAIVAGEPWHKIAALIARLK
jgi:galactitol-specific phosphotransferase system IIB component